MPRYSLAPPRPDYPAAVSVAHFVSAALMRALEEENRRLKQLLAETMLDNQALKGLLAKNW